MLDEINLRPKKPEAFKGRRDFRVVNTRIFDIEQYLALINLNNPNVPIPDENRIRFVSTFLKGSAAIWWINRVSTASTPSSWMEFKRAIIQEFVPAVHGKRARDKLCKMKQTRSVERFRLEFRNLILTIRGMHEDERIDRFLEGLK